MLQLLPDDSRSQPIQLATWGTEPAPLADKCDDGCKSQCCCPPPWAHRTGAFGELLFLRPRDAEVAYAVPIDSGLGPPPVQVGPVAVTDPDFSSGFRAGFSVCFDECSSVALTYTLFQSSTMDAVSLAGGGPVLRSLVLHPGSLTANSNFLNAGAQLDIDFDLIDADYRAVWWSSDRSVVNYLLGLRYTRMDRGFQRPVQRCRHDRGIGHRRKLRRCRHSSRLGRRTLRLQRPAGLWQSACQLYCRDCRAELFLQQ